MIAFEVYVYCIQIFRSTGIRSVDTVRLCTVVSVAVYCSVFSCVLYSLTEHTVNCELVSESAWGWRYQMSWFCTEARLKIK